MILVSNSFLPREITGDWGDNVPKHIYAQGFVIAKGGNVLGAEEINSSQQGSINAPSGDGIIYKSLLGHIFDEYFASQNSPLAGYGEDFVVACRKYGAPPDCTFLIGVAKVETDLCKTDISARQHNCWGFGGSGQNRILYDNFPQAIDEVTRRLMSGYGYRFFEQPSLAAVYIYCGNECRSWLPGVVQERARLRAFASSRGVEI